MILFGTIVFEQGSPTASADEANILQTKHDCWAGCLSPIHVTDCPGPTRNFGNSLEF